MLNYNIKKLLKEVVDKCGKLGSDLNDELIKLDDLHREEMKAQSEAFKNKDPLYIRIKELEEENKRLRCCGNCNNEKFLDRVYEVTVCDDCNNCSNWEIKKEVENDGKNSTL